MIQRRTMAMPRAAFLLLILAASATNQFVSSSSSSSSSSVEPRNMSSSTSRWLTYGCNSKNNDGDRTRFLSRILTHPCDSDARQSSSSTTSLYNNNTTQGSNTFVTVTLGIIAGVLTILGMLYVFDRETFTQVTGVKELPYDSCSCSKPRIDSDDESEPTPYERDVYLTRETQDYLEDKNDKEVEQPKRRLRNLFRCCFGTKNYDEGDKYQIPWTGSEDDKRKEAGNVNLLMVLLEDLKLRLFWRPTKEYDAKDKYDVEGAGDEDNYVIKIAASSYESAEVGTSPW